MECEQCGETNREIARSCSGDAILALTRGLEEVGFESMAERPIAIRGDRLVLTMRTWHDPHGFDLPLLACMEFGENGRMSRTSCSTPRISMPRRPNSTAATRHWEPNPAADRHRPHVYCASGTHTAAGRTISRH